MKSIISSPALISKLTWNDFRSKYTNTIFGYLWSLLSPLIMLMTLYMVFSYIVDLDIPHYQLFLLIGIIMWNYFSDSTTSSLNSIIANQNLLNRNKVSPRILIISSCLSSLISLLLSLFVFFLLMSFFGIPFRLIFIASIFYIMALFLVSYSMSLLLIGTYLHFKDIKHIWSFLLLIGFWMTPIVYSETTLPDLARRILMVNPIARVISHLRNLLIYNYLDEGYQLLITVSICFAILFFSLWAFSKISRNLIEKL